MRILEINDGFITNSSSASTTMLIAVKKGKDIFELLRILRIPDAEIENFMHDMNEINEWLEDIEYDDLLDEYDLYMANFIVASWGDEPYAEFPCYSYDVFVRYCPRRDQASRKNVIGEDLILIYLSDID